MPNVTFPSPLRGEGGERSESGGGDAEGKAADVPNSALRSTPSLTLPPQRGGNIHHRRLRAEQRFRRSGQGALLLAVVMLVILIGSLLMRGYLGFVQTQMRLTVTFDPAVLGLDAGDDATALSPSHYLPVMKAALRDMFPNVTDHMQQQQLYALISSDAGVALKKTLDHEPALLKQKTDVWVPAASLADMFFKGTVSESTPEADRNLTDPQVAWLKIFQTQGRVQQRFNSTFFSRGDSRSPEEAGFAGAMAGSAFTLIVCLSIVFPLGVMTAVYLEEFAKKSKLVDLIEVNINNLAAVPSIVFGLLGLSVYINFMGFPRSSALVGGMTLALMILPVIIITTRVSLSSIPRSIRDAARALGATDVQVVWHHVLPLAMPGIMTGTILGLSRAIGETAPLLMIGMVAFVADIPNSFTTAATVMPVQIYLWASSAEVGFVEKTAAGILVLLVLLLAMNALAIYLRKKFEVRW